MFTFRNVQIISCTVFLIFGIICGKKSEKDKFRNKNKKVYKSQYSQDRYLNRTFFHNKRNGVFVDIGAYTGLANSNTWYYEKKLGWSGICIEPSLSSYEKLVENRSCICIHGAIAPEEGKVLFREVKGGLGTLSGIESKYDPRQKEKWRLDEREYELIEVNTYRLNDLLEKHNIRYIDFLSLDTEGGELEILKSIDFEQFYIYTIAVENNFDSKEFREFLEGKGFRYLKNLWKDELYVNTKPYEFSED